MQGQKEQEHLREVEKLNKQREDMVEENNKKEKEQNDKVNKERE